MVSRRAWMPKDYDRELQRVSRISGKTCSEIVRDALKKHLGMVD
jgi:hypothetical protein